tara:strand:- start:2074 stop:4011 length:1938 start_codon:yes stop_codon:yes gene_type:complete
MAVTDRNIVITPNRTAVGKVQPKIVFTGADSSIGDSSAITLFANPENSGTLSFSGTAGQLFSITNDLTGTIFSVNDISGIPSLSINDQGIIQLAEFNGRVLIGGATDDSISSLQISGGLSADSAIFSDRIKSRTGHFSLNSEDSSSFATVVIGERTANDGIASIEFRNQSNTFSSKIDGAGSYFGVWTNKNSVNDYRIIANFGTADETIILKPSGTDRITANKYGATVNGTVNADSSTITGKINAGILEGRGGVTYDPPGSSGTDTATDVAVAVHSGDRIVLGENGFIRTIVDATWGSALQFGQSGTGAYAGTEIYGGNSGVSLYYSTTDRLETTDSGVNITGALRVNNAPFTSGGTDSASVIALIDSDYVQARTSGTRGTLNNVSSRSFTGDNSTTAFELQVTPADSDDVFVFVNGVLQHTNSYSISGNTITLDTAPDSSSTIDIRSHLIKSENVSLRDYKKYVYTLGSTVDSVSGADSAGATLTYDAGLVDVYVNGARLVTDKDYTAGNGSQVVFDSALGAGNIVEVVSHSRASVFTPEITSADVSLSTTDSGQNIDSFAKASFRTYKFTAQISHAASNSFHSEEVLLVHNGTNVAMTTFGQVLLDSNLGSFDAFISGANVQVKFSPTKTNTTVKLRGIRTPV